MASPCDMFPHRRVASEGAGVRIIDRNEGDIFLWGSLQPQEMWSEIIHCPNNGVHIIYPKCASQTKEYRNTSRSSIFGDFFAPSPAPHTYFHPVLENWCVEHSKKVNTSHIILSLLPAAKIRRLPTLDKRSIELLFVYKIRSFNWNLLNWTSPKKTQKMSNLWIVF